MNKDARDKFVGKLVLAAIVIVVLVIVGSSGGSHSKANAHTTSQTTTATTDDVSVAQKAQLCYQTSQDESSLSRDLASGQDPQTDLISFRSDVDVLKDYVDAQQKTELTRFTSTLDGIESGTFDRTATVAGLQNVASICQGYAFNVEALLHGR